LAQCLHLVQLILAILLLASAGIGYESSAYRHRAWHSYESWFNIATTDGCYGAEKGTSW